MFHKEVYSTTLFVLKSLSITSSLARNNEFFIRRLLFHMSRFKLPDMANNNNNNNNNNPICKAPECQKTSVALEDFRSYN